MHTWTKLLSISDTDYSKVMNLSFNVYKKTLVADIMNRNVSLIEWEISGVEMCEIR